MDKENRDFKSALYTRIMGDHLPPAKIFELLDDNKEEELSEDGYEIEELGDDEDGFSAEEIAFMKEQSAQFEQSIAAIQQQGYVVQDY